MDSLLSYPAVATAFIKINSILCSSAAVEKHFSAAVQVLTVRRCHMSDDTLKQHIFIRITVPVWRLAVKWTRLPVNYGYEQVVKV